MPTDYRHNITRVIIVLIIFIIVVSAVTTYFSARKIRSSLVRLIRKDAISLAEIFVAGSSSIYESQVSLINDLRMRLIVYGRMVEQDNCDLRQIPPEMAYSMILDSDGNIVTESGIITPQVSDWISQLDEIIAPLLEGKDRTFFGLDPEFPTATGPVGYARWCADSILIIFSYPPFHKEFGIGYLARQLAETPSVRYIFLQNEYGILIASKAVYRAKPVKSDPFLQNVLSQSEPNTRFTVFQDENVFELAYPFPRMGKFYGVLRIGIPLSEYEELSNVVLWTVLAGCLLALISIGAIIALGSVVNKIVSLRREHEKLVHLRSLGEISASVAHEIRNPLNAIAISLQRLKGEFEPKADSAEYGKIISSARSQTKRIDDIVREFIAVAGNISPVKTEIKIRDFFYDICAKFISQTKAKGIEFQSEYDIDGIMRVDREKFSRAVENILKNALEVTEPGNSIQLNVEKSKSKLQIHIINDGENIPEDILDTIFEPFTGRKPGGTGIGLFYTYRIVEAHNGKLNVRNITGGVEFTIIIPL